MNNEVPDHIRNPQGFHEEAWVSTKTLLGADNPPFQSISEFFLFVAAGNRILPIDCAATLDGKEIQLIQMALDRNKYVYKTEKSLPRIYFVDNKGRLICIETGDGLGAITLKPAKSVEKNPKYVFSPKAAEYLEAHPDVVTESVPPVNSGGRVSELASRLMESARKLFGNNLGK